VIPATAVAAGALTGLSLGSLGGGGSILTVPVLVDGLGQSAAQAARRTSADPHRRPDHQLPPFVRVPLPAGAQSARHCHRGGPAHRIPRRRRLGRCPAGSAHRHQQLQTAFTILLLLVAGYTAWRALPVLT
jgi:hypothetical protein